MEDYYKFFLAHVVKWLQKEFAMAFLSFVMRSPDISNAVECNGDLSPVGYSFFIIF